MVESIERWSDGSSRFPELIPDPFEFQSTNESTCINLDLVGIHEKGSSIIKVKKECLSDLAKA